MRGCQGRTRGRTKLHTCLRGSPKIISRFLKFMTFFGTGWYYLSLKKSLKNILIRADPSRDMGLK